MNIIALLSFSALALTPASQVVVPEKVSSPAPWLDVDVTTVNYGPGQLNQRATQGQKNLVNREIGEILKFRKELEADGGMLPQVQWTFDGGFTTKLNTSSVISWQFAGMTYTGGAHPNHILVGQVLVKQGSAASKATYSSLFKQASWSKVEQVVRAGFNQERVGRLGKDWARKEKVRYEDMNNFVTSKTGLVFLFPHYVMGSYAEGSYEVTVPWSRLVGHMTSQGLIVHTAATRN